VLYKAKGGRCGRNAYWAVREAAAEAASDWADKVAEYERIAEKLIELLKCSKPSKPKGGKEV
jgi:hypothetical protein